jgi:hypothetical protein
MTANVGDKISREGQHVGDKRREGVIVGLQHDDGTPPYRVRWLQDNRETLMYPGPDSRIEAGDK